MQPSIKENTWTAPVVYTFYIILADLLPITSQLISMVIVVDDVNQETMISTYEEKKSETTEDDWSLLNDDKKLENLQKSANLVSTSGLFKELSTKYVSTSSKGKH